MVVPLADSKVPVGHTQVLDEMSKTKLLSQATAVQTLLTKLKPGLQMEQMVGVDDEQARQLAGEPVQVPL